MKSRVVLIIMLVALLIMFLTAFSAAVSAQVTKNWVGGDGDWSDLAKWNPEGVPAADDNVVITATGTYTVTLTGSVTVGSLTIGATGNTGQTLWIKGTNTTSTGRLIINGDFTNAGMLKLESIEGGHQSGLEMSSGTFTNTGTINANQGTGGVRVLSGNITNQGTINVTSDSFSLQSGTFNNTNSSVITLNPGAGITLNSETFNNSSGSTFTIPSGVNLSAVGTTIFNNTGTFTIDGTVTYNGTFNNQTGGTFTDNGSFTMGSGVFNANGGAVNIGGSGYLGIHDSGSSLVANGSTFSGSPVINSANLNIASATGTPTFIFRNYYNALTASGGIPVGHTVWVQGTNTTSTGRLIINGDFTNAGMLKLESIEGGHQSGLEMSSGTFTNTGTINANQGTGGVRVLSGNITNQGTINVTSDSFSLQSGTFNNTNSSVITLNPGAGITLNSETFNNSSGSTFTIPSGVNLSAVGTTIFNNTGTFTIDGTVTYNGTFNNQTGGTFTDNGSFTMGSGVFNANGGAVNIGGSGYLGIHDSGSSLVANGSTFSGSPVINSANLNIASATGTPTFIFRNYYNALTASGGIPVGHTVWVQGTNTTSTGRLIINGDFTNAGMLKLESIEGGHQSGLEMSSGTFTNTGTINANQGTGGVRVLSGNITNQGTINVTSDSFSLQSGTFNNTNSSVITLNPGAGITLNSETFNNSSGSTFTIPSGVNLSAVGTTIFNNTGTFTIDGTVTYNGTFNNQTGGTFTDNGSFTMGSGVFNANGGAVNIGGSGYLGIHDSGSSLVANGSTFSGSPVINSANLNIASATGTPTFIFRNYYNALTASGGIPVGHTVWVQGTNTTSTGRLIINGDFTNAGMLKLESIEGGHQSGLEMSSGTFTNTGTINANQGTGGVRVLSGNITNQGTINVTSDSFSLQSGTFNNTNSSVITLNPGAGITLNSETFNNSSGSTFTIPSGVNLSAVGTTIFNNTGTFTIDGTVTYNGTFNNQTGGTFTDNGSFTMGSGVFNANGGAVNIGGSGYLGIHDSGSSLVANGSTFSGSPVINSANLNIASATGTPTFIFRNYYNALTASGGIPVGHTVWVQGTNTTSTGRLIINGDFTNAGMLKLESIEGGHQSGLEMSSGTFTNTGTINANLGSHGGGRVLAGNITNQGTINVTSDNLQIDNGTFRSIGPATIIGGGSLYLTQNVTFYGSGNITANINSGARIKIGASPGVLNLNGTFTQGPGGIVDIELGGTTAGTGFDKLNINGAASLAGTLNVTTINGFIPTAGNQFQFISYASKTGDFTTVNGVGVNLGNNMAVNRTITDTNQTLTAYALSGPNGQVSYWNLNEGSGMVAGDSWDGNNGTLIGGAGWTATGKVGKGLQITGIGRVEVPDSANLRITGPLTVEAWLKYNGLSGTGQNSPIVAKWGGSAPTNTASYALAIWQNGIPYFDISPDGSNVVYVPSSIPIAMNTFTHIAGVWTGTDVQLYVNGVMMYHEPSTGPIYASSVPVQIGGYNPADSLGYDSCINGVIDEAKIFNRALTAQEILAHYQAGQGTPPPIPVPGISPLGLGLMALLFVVAGYWGLRRGRRTINS